MGAVASRVQSLLHPVAAALDAVPGPGDGDRCAGRGKALYGGRSCFDPTRCFSIPSDLGRMLGGDRRVQTRVAALAKLARTINRPPGGPDRSTR